MPHSQWQRTSDCWRLASPQLAAVKNGKPGWAHVAATGTWASWWHRFCKDCSKAQGAQPSQPFSCSLVAHVCICGFLSWPIWARSAGSSWQESWPASWQPLAGNLCGTITPLCQLLPWCQVLRQVTALEPIPALRYMDWLSVSPWSLSTVVSLEAGGQESGWPCFLPWDTTACGEAVQALYIAGLWNCQARNVNAAVRGKKQMNWELLKGEGRNSGNLLHLNSHC